MNCAIPEMETSTGWKGYCEYLTQYVLDKRNRR